jgi:glycerol kinase
LPTILAIDQGASGTKAIVVDDAGQVRAIAEEPLHPRYLDGGGVEQDPQALLGSRCWAPCSPRVGGRPPKDAAARATLSREVPS